jgi:protein SCO1/2
MLSRIRTSAIAFLAAVALAIPAQAARMPQLIDQNGHAFTFQTLRGTPLVVTFISAHCTDACPLINAQFERAAQRFAQAHVRVKLLTITLDPEHDSLRDMHDVAQRFDADPRTWLVAGGSRADVHSVMRAFGVTAERGRRGYADVHTTFVYFIDARGTLRKTILASTVLSEQIVDEVRSK